MADDGHVVSVEIDYRQEEEEDRVVPVPHRAHEAGKDLSDFAISVSIELLESLGLERYIPIIEKNGIGIDEFVNLGLKGLDHYGIKDYKHRAMILGRVAKGNVRSSPPKVDGKPVKVMAKLGISRISEINTVDLTVRIKLFIDLYWCDPRMIGASREQVPDYIWIPDCYVSNSTQRSGEGGGKLVIHPPARMNSERGLMLNALEVEVVLTNEMDLRKFPFDTDDIVMKILQSENSNAAEWIFAPWESDKEGDGLENCVKCFYDIFDVPEFDINGWSIDMFQSFGGNGVDYSHLFLHIHIARRPMYYIRTIMIPIMLTTTLAFTAFFYDIDDLEARNNGTATTFLTTVAFLYVLTSSLPKTNYATSINYAVVLSFVVQLFIWAITNINSIVVDVDPAAAASLDRYASIILPLFYYLSTLVLFIGPMISHWRTTRMDPPPEAKMQRQMYGRTDDNLPIYAKPGTKKYFPFIAWKNVFY